MSRSVQIFYSGDWHDLPLLGGDPIVYSWGRPDRLADVTPGKLTCSVDNASGNYSPRKTSGPLYGLIGRNTPVRVLDDAVVEWVGEIESWPLESTVDDGMVWVPITANGIMRRLGGAGDQAPVKSALRRWYDHLDEPPTWYWPLEDAQGATEGWPAVGGIPLAYVIPGATHPGEGVSPPGALPGTSLVPGWDPDSGEAGPGLRATGLGIGSGATQLVLDLWFTADISAPPEGTAGAMLTIRLHDAFSVFLQLVYQPNLGVAGAFITVGIGAPPTEPPIGNLFDGLTHNVRLVLDEDGADTDGSLYVDGVLAGSAFTITGQLIPALDIIDVPSQSLWLDSVGASLGLLPVSFSHVAVWSAYSSIPSAYDAGQGHTGENAVTRFTRLCAEEGITASVSGTSTTTMGPQPAGPVLDAIREIRTADGGMLGEDRAQLGLTYRTRSDMYNQAAVLTLSRTAGDEIMPGTKPVDDTTDVRNDVTVTTPAGRAARRVRETGPLNVAEPIDDPPGVGRYPLQVTANVDTDAELAAIADWERHLGTYDAPRWPVVITDLRNLVEGGKSTKAAAAKALAAGDRVDLEDLPDWAGPAEAALLVLGGTVTLAIGKGGTSDPAGTVEINAAPAAPWEVFVLGDPVRGVLGVSRLAR